jgi:predicted phosphatase
LNRTVGVDVFIVNETGTLEKVIPSEIIKIDDNTVHVTWPWPMIGEATVA